MNETRKEAMKALPKESIEKPGTNHVTDQNKSAFRTKVKSPRERMLIGSVNKKRIGRISAFKIPSTTATRMASPKPLK
jgi:hypothetical protein